MEINMLIQGLRGFWTGFERTLYDNSTLTISPRCFNDKTVSEIYFLVNFLKGKESLVKVVQFVTTTQSLINDNMLYCGYQEAVRDIEEFCKATESCSPGQLAQNLTSRFFALLGEVQHLIVTIAEEFPPSSKEDMYLQSFSVGTTAGHLVRTTFNYQ